jgi:hypothetical protein
MKYLLLFHGKYFYANAPQYGVIRTVPVLLSSDFSQNYNRWTIFCVRYFWARCICTASLGQGVSHRHHHRLYSPGWDLASSWGLVTIFFLWGGFVSLTPNPRPGGPGYPFSSGSSPLTCLAWETLPVAYATCSIARRIIWPHKPRHYAKVGIPSGGQGVSRTLKFYWSWNVLNLPCL